MTVNQSFFFFFFGLRQLIRVCHLKIMIKDVSLFAAAELHHKTTTLKTQQVLNLRTITLLQSLTGYYYSSL